MPFPFTLATTSNVDLAEYYRSDTHPSLILAAATQRTILRSALKTHKRLAAPAQLQNLHNVLAVVDEYLPYLLALDAGLSGKPVNDEEITVILQKEIEVDWRSSLSSSHVGNESSRIKGKGLDYEIAFVLHTKACIATLQAKAALHKLRSVRDDKKEIITRTAVQAKDHLLVAESIHKYLATRGVEGQFPAAAIDINPTIQNALANLASAEATLMVILSQDPYPAAVLQSRDKEDRDWMYKAREIPKVRASLCGRLAVRAAEYSERASTLLGPKIDKNFSEYVRGLASLGRARACRFLAIDAELGGKVGDALAWLVAGKKFLGYKIREAESTKVSSLSKLKMEWTQRREDKKAEKTGEIVLEGGKSDEVRALDLLEQEFEKTNDMISHQIIPPSDSLLSTMPSGRDVIQTQPLKLPVLEQEIIARLRAPIDAEEAARLRRELAGDSDGEDETDIPGAFPDSQGQSSSYF